MRRVATALGRIFHFARRLRLARARYGRSYRALARDYRHLIRNERYTPKEVFRCDLLSRESAARRDQASISKRVTFALQQQLNPEEAASSVEDKTRFSSTCAQRGLPTPRLLGVWTPEGGRSGEGAPLSHDADWRAFFESLDEAAVVVKPTYGFHGRGIRFLERCDGGWRDQRRRVLTHGELIAELRRDPEFDHFVVQERTVSHPDLVALSGTDYLQTTRVITGVMGGVMDGVTGATAVRILGAEQKIICGGAAVSNFAWGATGNAVGDVDPATGRLGTVLMAREDGVGMDPVSEHPLTGETFHGFVLPFWAETRSLCEEAALAFRPLLTIGWDVGASPDGPVLIEGNAWWDPLAHGPGMGEFRRYARRVLGSDLPGPGASR